MSRASSPNTSQVVTTASSPAARLAAPPPASAASLSADVEAVADRELDRQCGDSEPVQHLRHGAVPRCTVRRRWFDRAGEGSDRPVCLFSDRRFSPAALPWWRHDASDIPARMRTTETTTTVVVPGTHLMAALLGPRDQHLRQIEDAFPDTAIHVRGNEVSVTGDQSDEVGRLFEELVDLLERGHQLDPANLSRVITMNAADERPSEVLTHDLLKATPRRQVRRRPLVRSATSTPSPAMSSPSASGRQAPASRGWRWRWPSRRSRPSRCTGSSSPGPPSRPASDWASSPAT